MNGPWINRVTAPTQDQLLSLLPQVQIGTWFLRLLRALLNFQLGLYVVVLLATIRWHSSLLPALRIALNFVLGWDLLLRTLAPGLNVLGRRVTGQRRPLRVVSPNLDQHQRSASSLRSTWWSVALGLLSLWLLALHRSTSVWCLDSLRIPCPTHSPPLPKRRSTAWPLALTFRESNDAFDNDITGGVEATGCGSYVPLCPDFDFKFARRGSEPRGCGGPRLPEAYWCTSSCAYEVVASSFDSIGCGCSVCRPGWSFEAGTGACNDRGGRWFGDPSGGGIGSDLGRLQCCHSSSFEAIRPSHRQPHCPAFLSRLTGDFASTELPVRSSLRVAPGVPGRQDQLLYGGRGRGRADQEPFSPCYIAKDTQEAACKEGDCSFGLGTGLRFGSAPSCPNSTDQSATRTTIKAGADGEPVYAATAHTCLSTAFCDPTKVARIFNERRTVPVKSWPTSKNQNPCTSHRRCSEKRNSARGGTSSTSIRGRLSPANSRCHRDCPKGSHLSDASSAVTGLDSVGVAPSGSGWFPGLRRRIKLELFPLLERVKQTGEAVERLSSEKGRIFPQGCTERLPAFEASRSCALHHGGVPVEAHLHEVPGEARWFCWQQRPWACDVATCSGGGSDGSVRSPRSRRDVGPCNGGHRASSPGWQQVGSGVAALLTGGTTGLDVCCSPSCYKSQDSSLCSSLPSGVDCNNIELCQGTRHPDLPQSRSYAEEASAQGRGQGKETKAQAVSEEAKAGVSEESADDDAPASSSPNAFEFVSSDQKLLQTVCVPSSASQSSAEEKTYVPEFTSARSERDPAMPTWSSMQEFSFSKWCSMIWTRTLSSRTPFAEFLRTTLLAVRPLREAPPQALFPLPVPKAGIFASKKVGSRERAKRSFERAFHVVVMAMNYWHADFRFIPPQSLDFLPNAAQTGCLATLRSFVLAFGNCEDVIKVPSSGRRSSSLISMLSDLSDFITWEGLSGDHYRRSFPGDVSGYACLGHVQPDLSKAEELQPYRPLDPDRLKITGQAQWDPLPHLSDALWLAFAEPSVLKWTSTLPPTGFPDLPKEDYSKVLKLAKLWDTKGLLFLREVAPDFSWEDGAMRFFNNYKSIDADRMIGDRRLRNWQEARLPGVSRGLPNAASLSVLEIDPVSQTLSICISDRKDFYHQVRIPPTRAKTNGLWPLLHVDDINECQAFKEWASQQSGRRKYDRLLHGDHFGIKPILVNDPKDKQARPCLQACFNSLPQGDHLGVEVATDAHRNFLKDKGLLDESQELRADSTFRGTSVLQGLVIDDFYTVSVGPAQLSSGAGPQVPPALTNFKKAKRHYSEAGILGSDDKDVINLQKAKVTGGELDSSSSTRSLGLTTLAAPAAKRLALAFVSLELANLRFTTDAIHACLLGGWTSALMYRRPMMSILRHSYKCFAMSDVDQDQPKVFPLERAVAEELLILAILSPLISSNLAATFEPKIYASDSSDKIGAYVSRPADVNIVRAMWRTSRRKTGYVRMLSREEALIRKLDTSKQEHQFALFDDEATASMPEDPERPIALMFHFVEVCGGAGKISKNLAELGWNIGPVLDLDSSPFFDFQVLRMIQWIYFMLEQGRLDSFMLQPPCTTFSPAQYPPSRGYDVPRGYDPLDPKTLLGTTLALRSLAVMKLAYDLVVPGLTEQPKRSKMRKLEEWLWLVETGRALEVFTASCMFGSPHLKEFCFLSCNLDTSMLVRRCDKSHSHVKIEGKFTKPSAVYVDALALELALCFDKALAAKIKKTKLLEPATKGLENCLTNDMLVSGTWTTESSWTWKVPAHINIFETNAVCRLLKRLAIRKPHSRPVIIMDSNVGLSALVKGRSSSDGLRKCLRRAGALVVAGDLLPGYQFGPTRINTADCPTRLHDFPEPALPMLRPLAPLIRFWTLQT